MKPIIPFLRHGVYHFRKRVPRRYASVEPIPIMQLSLHTDSLEIAKRKAPQVWAEMIEAWEAKLDGDSKEGEARLTAARNLAQRRGFRFLHVRDVAKLPLEQIVQRMDMIPDSPSKADLPIIEVALGTPAKSAIKVSEAFDEFYEISADLIHGKSEDQIRRHKNPRQKATRNFIEAVSDMALSQITDEDMSKFRKWLMARVTRGEVTADTANKDMTYLRSMWKAVAKSKGFKMKYESEGLLLKSPPKAKTDGRKPFSEKWIKTKILAPGALGGLNTDARLILLAMINTGARPGEIAGLMPDEILLDGDVPMVLIRPNAQRTIKNASSERYIPLTGVSLEAMKEAKSGFPKYASNSATLSATVNKFMRENGLMETPDHVAYSLRHSFEDRMLRAGIDERIRKDLLGHQISRERYGDGGGVKHVHDLLKPIAL